MMIDYNELGTISKEQLLHALYDDLCAMEEHFGVSFYTGAKLVLYATNEWGDPRFFKRDGSRVTELKSYHYRPACLDYHL